MQNGKPITDEQGNQATVAQIAGDIMQQAREKMGGMENEIADQLNECQYNAECRKGWCGMRRSWARAC